MGAGVRLLDALRKAKEQICEGFKASFVEALVRRDREGSDGLRAMCLEVYLSLPPAARTAWRPLLLQTIESLDEPTLTVDRWIWRRTVLLGRLEGAVRALEDAQRRRAYRRLAPGSSLSTIARRLMPQRAFRRVVETLQADGQVELVEILTTGGGRFDEMLVRLRVNFRIVWSICRLLRPW